MIAPFDTSRVPGPHAAAEVLTEGTKVDRATAAAILLHGRGGSAEDILSLGRATGRDGIALVASQAEGHSWYPLSFLAPLEQNQPHVDSAHALIESLIAQIVEHGIPSGRIALIGFSQGACLAADHAARFPRRYGLIACCTGGLIGPLGTSFESLTRPGALTDTPIFLGANDPDPHVPWPRVEETARVLGSMDARVELVRYPDMPHAVNRDQVRRIREAMDALASEPAR